MSNDVTLTGPAGANLPAAFKNAKVATVFQNADLETGSEGIEGSYPIIKFAGKVWSLQYRGENRKFMRPDGDGARGSIDAIFIRMATNKAKTFYPPGFKDGSKEKPVCWSDDGARPDPAVPPSQKQAPACAACPKNVFGSRVTDDGKPAKACGDHKRTAIVLDPAMVMALLGIPLSEPCLLRVPAASLNDFSTFADTMKAQGFPLQSFVTKISFDATKNYPKFKFEAVRPLTDEEGVIVMAYRDDVVAHRIVSDSAMVADGAEDVPAVPAEGNTVASQPGPNLGMNAGGQSQDQPNPQTQTSISPGNTSQMTNVVTGQVIPLNVAPRQEALNPNPPRDVTGPTGVQTERLSPAQQALAMAQKALADEQAAAAKAAPTAEQPPLEMQTQDVVERPKEEAEPGAGPATNDFDKDINDRISKLLG